MRVCGVCVCGVCVCEPERARARERPCECATVACACAREERVCVCTCVCEHRAELGRSEARRNVRLRSEANYVGVAGTRRLPRRYVVAMTTDVLAVACKHEPNR